MLRPDSNFQPIALAGHTSHRLIETKYQGNRPEHYKPTKERID